MAKRQADGQRTKDESSDEEEVDVSELARVVMARCGRVESLIIIAWKPRQASRTHRRKTVSADTRATSRDGRRTC